MQGLLITATLFIVDILWNEAWKLGVIAILELSSLCESLYLPSWHDPPFFTINTQNSGFRCDFLKSYLKLPSFMVGCTYCVCTAYMWKSVSNLKELVFSLHHVSLELRSSSLLASAFTYWAIFLVPVGFLSHICHGILIIYSPAILCSSTSFSQIMPLLLFLLFVSRKGFSR